MSIKQKITALAYDKRGRLLAVGNNSYVKTHPLQAKYAKKTGYASKIFLHAEIDALIRARSHIHKLVVIRRGVDGKEMLARPCPTCQLAIKEYGVRIVEHT